MKTQSFYGKAQVKFEPLYDIYHFLNEKYKKETYRTDVLTVLTIAAESELLTMVKQQVC